MWRVWAIAIFAAILTPPAAMFVAFWNGSEWMAPPPDRSPPMRPITPELSRCIERRMTEEEAIYVVGRRPDYHGPAYYALGIAEDGSRVCNHGPIQDSWTLGGELRITLRRRDDRDGKETWIVTDVEYGLPKFDGRHKPK
jgi:hypothetical protein